MQEELAQQAGRLDKREQALADRLVTYHEWMEFPQPIELSPARTDRCGRSPSWPARTGRCWSCSRRETQVLYDNILQNKYASEGKVLLPVIRDDVLVAGHPRRPHLSAGCRAAAPGSEPDARASRGQPGEPADAGRARRAAGEREARQPEHALRLRPQRRRAPGECTSRPSRTGRT